MYHKKIRGIKRKTKDMVRSIEELTEEFPSDFYRGFWHIHLPVAPSFIDSEKTPKSIRRLCIQTLVDRTEHLISIKPSLPEVTRVVAAIALPNLWDSQIIIFMEINILTDSSTATTNRRSGFLCLKPETFQMSGS